MTVGSNSTLSCSICGSKIEGKFTRVVGFLVNVDDFHKVRRDVDFPNRQFYSNVDNVIGGLDND